MPVPKTPGATCLPVDTEKAELWSPAPATLHSALLIHIHAEAACVGPYAAAIRAMAPAPAKTAILASRFPQVV